MARLSKGVRERKDGLLEKRFSVNGKGYSVYGHTKKEIEEKEMQLREKIRNGVYKENKSITLDYYFAEWLRRKEKYNKGNTLKNYKSIYYNHISDTLGKCKVSSIEKRQVLDLQDKLLNTTSVYTVNFTIRILRIILNDAIADEIIIKNPCYKIKAIKSDKEKATETIHRALTIEEQKAFMSYARSNFYYELFAFMLLTGMRVGEVGALTWKDIDNKNNVIHVNKTITFDKDNKATIGTPKTETSNRDIPMTEDIRRILKEQRTKTDILFNGVQPIDNHIFVTSYGTQICSDYVIKSINSIIKTMKKSGITIKPFTTHAFRDTFATRYIEQGGNPQTLKTILGHSSFAMTMDLYAHVLPNTKQEEMQRLSFII